MVSYTAVSPLPLDALTLLGAVYFYGTIRFFRLIERPPGITPGHPTLRSPDFPPRTRRPDREERIGNGGTERPSA